MPFLVIFLLKGPFLEKWH